MGAQLLQADQQQGYKGGYEERASKHPWAASPRSWTRECPWDDWAHNPAHTSPGCKNLHQTEGGRRSWAYVQSMEAGFGG